MNEEELIKETMMLDYSQLVMHNVYMNKENKRLENIIKEVREIFKDYGDKEDIVGYTMYNITGEMLIALLEILDKTN